MEPEVETNGNTHDAAPEANGHANGAGADVEMAEAPPETGSGEHAADGPAQGDGKEGAAEYYEDGEEGDYYEDDEEYYEEGDEEEEEAYEAPDPNLIDLRKLTFEQLMARVVTCPVALHARSVRSQARRGPSYRKV